MEKMMIKYANEYRMNEAIDLRIEYFKEAYSNFTKEKEEELRINLRNYFMTHLGRDCFVVLAIVDGKTIACSILNVFSKAPNLRMPNGKYAEIYGVFTQKEYRHKGYATALIKELLVASERMDMSFVELEASGDGKPVYLECGFEEVNSEYTKMKYYFDGINVLR